MNQSNDDNRINRRSFGIGTVTAGAAVAGIAAAGTAGFAADDTVNAKAGKLNQSLCRWCYGNQSLEELCKEAKQIGLAGIDLLKPNDFDLLKKYGLVCTMVSSHDLDKGLCDEKYRDYALKIVNEMIEATAKEGWRNVICFSGNARGIDRKVGMKNCVAALKEIVPVAEKKNIILSMELLNSRVDHGDYMCDNTTWGIELVKQVGSKNFKLLYDIYHMQIMEGDVMRSIQKNHEYFGHYHTGGNPGRHELDGSQELNYIPISKAIVDTGFDGYFAHEFIPVREPLVSLREAVKLCTVT